jgi:hypothetical protein
MHFLGLVLTCIVVAAVAAGVASAAPSSEYLFHYNYSVAADFYDKFSTVWKWGFQSNSFQPNSTGQLREYGGYFNDAYGGVQPSTRRIGQLYVQPGCNSSARDAVIRFTAPANGNATITFSFVAVDSNVNATRNATARVVFNKVDVLYSYASTNVAVGNSFSLATSAENVVDFIVSAVNCSNAATYVAVNITLWTNTSFIKFPVVCRNTWLDDLLVYRCLVECGTSDSDLPATIVFSVNLFILAVSLGSLLAQKLEWITEQASGRFGLITSIASMWASVAYVIYIGVRYDLAWQGNSFPSTCAVVIAPLFILTVLRTGLRAWMLSKGKSPKDLEKVPCCLAPVFCPAPFSTTDGDDGDGDSCCRTLVTSTRVANLMWSLTFAIFAFVSNDIFDRVQERDVPSEFYASSSYYNYYGVGPNSTFADLCLRPGWVLFEGERIDLSWLIVCMMYLVLLMIFILPPSRKEGDREEECGASWCERLVSVEFGGLAPFVLGFCIVLGVIAVAVTLSSRGLPEIVIDVQSALSVTVVPAVTGALEGLHSKMRNCCS